MVDLSRLTDQDTIYDSNFEFDFTLSIFQFVEMQKYTIPLAKPLTLIRSRL